MTRTEAGSGLRSADSARLVVGLGPIPAEVVEPALGPGFEFIDSPDANDLQNAEAAIVRAAENIGAQELARMPNLRLLVRPGVGYDAVDIDAARRVGVGVAITPGTNTNAVAEGAFGHILHLLKSLGPYTEMIRRGGWSQRVDYSVGDLEGGTLGIIGYGRIGQRMHSLAAAFDMKVLAYDPVVEVPSEVRADLSELFAHSTVISVHVPLLPSTKGLISRSEIASMRMGTILVNVSRGGIVDEDAAHEGLVSGRLGGVGLDVFSPEPPNDHPLFHHEKVVLTPHMLGISTRASRENYLAAAKSVRSFFSGGDDFTLVN